MTTLAMPQSAWKPSSKVRENFSEAVDTAASGRFVTFQRNQKRFVMQNADHLRSALVKLIPSNAQVVAENNGFSMSLPGLPISADGETFDEVLGEAVDALRDYADAWQERLYLAPNHRANAGLALLVTLASDEELKEWLVSE